MAAAPADWPDDRLGRVAALALLEELRGRLLTEPSATLTLQHWCDQNGLAAAPATIVATRLTVTQPTLDVADRARLKLGAGDPVGYRHVRLSCGTHLLSEADNWYVPARLTTEMNRTLDNTQVPFGRVVQPLGFTRTTLSSRLLWSPLPPGWPRVAAPAARPGQALAIPDALIENRAILARADGMPFSLVVETYRHGVLEMRPPAP